MLSSLGEQAAVALVAPSDYSLTLASPAQISGNFAVVYLQALKDEAPARALLGALKEHFATTLGPAQIHEAASGYDVALGDLALGISLELHFVKGYLCLAIGHTALVERSLRALANGESTLGEEAAHKAARAALPSTAHVFAWADVGPRAERRAQNALLAARVTDIGLDGTRIHWSGPERVTTALAVSAELQKGVYTYRADALNLPAIGGLFAAARL